MSGALTAPGWRTCDACGHWQRASAESACSACQWPRLLAVGPTVTRGATALRVLLDTEYRSDRTWHLAGFTTDRLAGALDQAAVLQRLSEDGLRVLKNRTKGAPSNALPLLRAWEEFREVARALLAEELNSLIRRSWEGLRLPSEANVVVAVRILLLDPDLSRSNAATPAWLEIVPFHAAAAAAAAKVRAEDVEVDCSRARVCFAPGGATIEAALLSPAELLIETCEVVAGARPIWGAPVTRVVRRQQRTALPPIALSADAVRGLAPNRDGQTTGELRIWARGRGTPFTAALPAAELPPFDNVANLFLDLGSTTTKWALRIGGTDAVQADNDTRTLTEGWGVDAYRKADLLADSSGERWSAWVARVLPALRQWVGSEYKGYLRYVYISLPTTGQFDVKQLGAERPTGRIRGDPVQANPIRVAGVRLRAGGSTRSSQECCCGEPRRGRASPARTGARARRGPLPRRASNPSSGRAGIRRPVQVTRGAATRPGPSPLLVGRPQNCHRRPRRKQLVASAMERSARGPGRLSSGCGCADRGSGAVDD